VNDDLTLIIDSVFELRFRGQVIIGVLNDRSGLDSHSIDLDGSTFADPFE
jgi:hypothetical protein